ncbi:MAG: hypothetical protein ND895_24235 [Pyrinomonadaceae bacterium]|nr:hypothetical protein [Pyrinomonadaceae bacterium]
MAEHVMSASNSSTQHIRIWGILSVALPSLAVLSPVLAAFILDVFVDRPGSVTTSFPGVAYGAALIMKVSIALVVVVTVTALVKRERPSWPGPPVPVWGSLSLTLTLLAPLFAALAVVTAQALVAKPESLSYFHRVSRTGVLVMLASIAAGVFAAVIALTRRERPCSLAILGLVTNACLIGLFKYFEFYKLGFDQDRWAAP